MKIHNQTLQVETTSKTDLIDLTEAVQGCFKASETSEGMASLFIPGSTTALTTIEYESGALDDLKKALQRWVPEDMPYAHDRRWGDGNGFSHVRAALLGPSLTIPIVAGRLLLGTWQQIVLCDYDDKPRERRVSVQFIGKE